MKEQEVIEVIREFISKKFPRQCGVCGKQFRTFGEYVRDTNHVGNPVSYDAEDSDWQPAMPLGTVALANCSCGSTLAIDSTGMKLWTMWRLMRWARRESAARGIPIDELLQELRLRIDERVLSDLPEDTGGR